MGERHTVNSDVSPHFLEKIDEEAEEQGISRSKYVRQRIRAGRLLWNGAQFQPEVLEEITNRDKVSSHQREGQLKTPSDDIAGKILKELPDSSHDEGVSKNELRKLIFGTKEEQLEYIELVLNELYQEEQVDRAFEGGFVKSINE